MARPSSIDRLPDAIKAAIGQLRQSGHTIDEILAHLADMKTQVSRSALGRHVKGFDKIADKMRQSRDVATALVRELGDLPESKTAKLNIELIHSAVMDLFMNAPEGGEADADGKAATQGNPMGLMMLAKALDHLGRASKSNVEFVALAEKRAADKARQESVAAVEAVAKDAGLSSDTVTAIKEKIFGVKPDALA
jgi:uncharacterized protein YukE